MVADMRRLWVVFGALVGVACGGGGEVTTAAMTTGGPSAGTSGTGEGSETGGTEPTTTTPGTTSTTTGPTTSGPMTTGPMTSTTATTGDTGEPPGCGAEVVTFASGKTPGQIIHVAPGGADTADCGAEGQPCAGIAHAAGLATPGTAVRVHAGTYAADQFVSDLAGTADAPIWIGGAPGEARPIIQGGTEALHLSRVRYVVVHDLEVAGATGNGINTDDGGQYDDPEAARFVVFDNVYIHDIGQGGNEDCLKLSGLNDYWVLRGEFANCGAGGSAIDHVGCHQGLIVGNYFHDNGANAVQAKGGSEDIEIRGNRMIDCGERAVNMGGSTGFEFFRPPLRMDVPNVEARDIRVIANVIVGGETPLAFVGCVGCLAANNTIVRPNHWLMRILQETVTTQEYEFLPSGQNTFANNVVVFERGAISTYVNIGVDTAPETFTFSNNLWYASDDPGQSSPAGDLPVAETNALVGMDPLLVDVAGGDYHVTAQSPAVGSGTLLPALSVDLDGVCYADPPTRGAFELPM